VDISRGDNIQGILGAIGPFWPKWGLGGPFNAKPIIQTALRKSHVNGATKVKLYSYIGIGKCLGGVKIFPLGASGGRRAP